MNIITIDGPTASGKGTTSKKLAMKLKWNVLDSGSIYRSLSFLSIKNNIHPYEIEKILELLVHFDLKFIDEKIFLNNINISDEIRKESVGYFASILSMNRLVREKLILLQRKFFNYPGLVADGRDMGTVVFPCAKLKIFLIADINIRAKRRFNQLTEKGYSANLGEIIESIRIRDSRDINRTLSPLIKADDAHVIDSSHMSPEKVVDIILNIWMNRSDNHNS